MIGFRKASKAQSFLRLAMFGPPGSGKTYSCLGIAKGMGEAIGSRVAVIDTERGSASKYADRFEFDVRELERPEIEAYVEALKLAAKADYKIVVIDSLSHGWQELLNEIDQIAARMGGNTWAAWSKGTPKQRLLVDAILRYPGHVLATMRAKTTWEVGEGRNGKKAPVKIGLAPEQGKGIEYEFDFLGSIDDTHAMKVEKDRTGKYQDKFIDKPGAEFGADLVAWLNEGNSPPVIPAARTEPEPTREHRPEPAREPARSEMPAKTHDNKPATEDFDRFAGRKIAGFKGWCDKQGVPFPQKEVHPNRLLNALITRAIEAGGVESSEVTRAIGADTPVRQNPLMYKAFDRLMSVPEWAEWIEAESTAYLKEKAEAEAIRSTEGGND